MAHYTLPCIQNILENKNTKSSEFTSIQRRYAKNEIKEVEKSEIKRTHTHTQTKETLS